MPFTLTMPKLSPTMEEGTIVKWHVKEGDSVNPGDLLIEVATDKATVEHSALDKGFIRKILIREKESAIVNQPIAICTDTLSESIEGFIIPSPQKIVVSPSQLETAQDFPTSNIAKPASSSLGMPDFIPEPPLALHKEGTHPSTFQGRLLASPLAKQLAKEKGVDLATVKGSGPRGRILAQDIEPLKGKALVSFETEEPPSIAPGSYEEESLTVMRKTIGKRLQESKTFIPHFYVSQEIDSQALVTLREQLKNGGVQLTVNDFILRATALALREHPQINSGFHSVNQTLIRFKTIDIAVAVSLPTGLITPIIRQADYKNLQELSSEMRHLATKAKEGKLSREEYMGGSFTISNLGMFKVSGFGAIINPPQAAILAIGGIQEKPIVRAGQIVPGKIMTMTLSADHRVVDGTDGAKFINTLKMFLENPALLLV